MTTVLIVDDSPTETYVLQKILESGGYRTLTATDGANAIGLIRRRRPDLVLMDVVMPGLNGFQATRMLSRDPETAHIPVIIVTTKDQETDVTWGLRQGARHYLIKPVSPGDLLDKVREAIQA